MCFLLIKCATEINGNLCEKYCCSCVIGEGNDANSGEILGNMSKSWETLL